MLTMAEKREGEDNSGTAKMWVTDLFLKMWVSIMFSAVIYNVGVNSVIIHSVSGVHSV